MIEFSLKTNIDKLPLLLRIIHEDAVVKAVRRTMNRSIEAMATKAKDQVREHYPLAAGKIKKDYFRVKRATGNSLDVLEADLRVSTKPVSLISLSRRKTPYRQKGVKVANRAVLKPIALAGGGIIRLPRRAFIAQAKGTQGSGESFQIFVRGKTKTSKGKVKLHKKAAPSLYKLLQKEKLMEPLRKYAGDKFTETFRSNFNFYLGQIPKE